MMSAIRSKRVPVLTAIVSLALLLAVAAPAAADEPPAFEATLPAGLACAGFDLGVAGYGSGSQVYREFSRPGGTVVSLSAGTGYALVFTNLATDASLELDASGAVSLTATDPDGSAVMSLMGHNVVILFPSDGGPSTTLYVGRVVIGVAPDGTWTVLKNGGTATDICAAIS